MARHLLVTNDYPPKTGGIQNYLHELWRRLEEGRAVVITASSHDDAQRFDATSNVVIERVKNSTLFFPSVASYRAIEEAITRHQPDLVLLDPAWPLGLLGPRLSRPYGVVVHGAEVTIPGRIPVVASSLRYVLKNAEVVICAGSYPEREVRRNAAELLGPVLQVPPGVDTVRFTPLDESTRREVRLGLGVGENEVLVTSYSRLVPRKGMDTLIRASARLRDRHQALHVVIGGSGRDQRRLEHLAQKLDAPVTFSGRVSDEELPRWLGASDLMVVDCRSRWFGLEQEGFGIVFVEASACGVVPVAGRSGGSDEAVVDAVTGAVMQNPRSARELADTLSLLIDNYELRSTYARRARALAVEKFSWDELARELSRGLSPFDHFETTTSLL